MQPPQPRIFSGAQKVKELLDSACQAARDLAESIHRSPRRAYYRSTYNAATVAFTLLSQMEVRGVTLHGAEGRVRIRQALHHFEKIKRSDCFLDFESELAAAIEHIGEFLHAVIMLRKVNGGVKAPAPPAESSSKQTDTVEATPDEAPAKPVEEHPDARAEDRAISPPITFGSEKDGSITVNGNPKSVTPAQFVALKVLAEAYPDGLVKDKLEAEAGDAARNTLKRLQQDPDFAKVISFPGQLGQGRGYRLIWPESP